MAALGVAAVVLAETSLVEAPDPQSVASGVWLIPGGIRPNRQPDGNSVVFEAPEGLVVIDTGRHAWHREAILSLARAQRKDVVAIVNTHWHLDHVSGNPDLRAAYPQVRVHASSAIDGALTGFLPASAADSAAYLDDPKIPEETREDIRADLLTIQNGGALKPDVVIAASGTTALGGLALRISLVPDAVTAGDVWIYDSARRVAVLGDLVTLPAPFLDTACPQGWKAALDAVAATPFEVAIPGHGAPMSRAQFLLYQAAFEAFIDCSGSTTTGDCWARMCGSTSRRGEWPPPTSTCCGPMAGAAGTAPSRRRSPVLERFHRTLAQARAPLREQFPQHGAVAPGFFRAVAPNREIRRVRQRRERVEQRPVVRVLHLCTVTPNEDLPASLVAGRHGRLCRLEQVFARREVRQPDVVEVARRVLALRHATRWPPHRTDPQPFAGHALAAESNDPDRHATPPLQQWIRTALTSD